MKLVLMREGSAEPGAPVVVNVPPVETPTEIVPPFTVPIGDPPATITPGELPT